MLYLKVVIMFLISFDFRIFDKWFFFIFKILFFKGKIVWKILLRFCLAFLFALLSFIKKILFFKGFLFW